MKRKNSNEIFADFYTDVPSGVSRMAAAFGVHKDTASKWRSPKPSETNPTATGKGNPLDQTLRAMKIIHPHDPARAREIVDFFERECDELDRLDGIHEADDEENPCALIAQVVKSSARLVMEDLRDCRNPEKIKQAQHKLRKLIVNVNKLDACLKTIMNGDEQSPE